MQNPVACMKHKTWLKKIVIFLEKSLIFLEKTLAIFVVWIYIIIVAGEKDLTEQKDGKKRRWKTKFSEFKKVAPTICQYRRCEVK